MELFRALDIEGKGYLTKKSFQNACKDLAIGNFQLDSVFSNLDVDGDGRISETDFLTGYRRCFLTLLSMESDAETTPVTNGVAHNPDTQSIRNVDSQTIRKQDLQTINNLDSNSVRNSDSRAVRNFDSQAVRNSDSQAVRNSDSQAVRNPVSRTIRNPDSQAVLAWKQFTSDIGVELYVLLQKSQEQLCELYQQLHEAGLNDQLAKFEDIVVSVIKDVRQQQCENERLERSYKREKEQHARHLRHLEEDMDTQMQKVESRVRKEEREKFESEKEDMKTQLESEISELQANLKRLQTLDVQIPRDKPNDEMRCRLDEILLENRSTKRNLTDAQTSLALLRSELAALRVQYEDKCYEMEAEKQAVIEYGNQHENLTRQILMLHEANKKLHDTNDDLREALESSRTQKRPHSNYRIRRPSIILTGDSGQQQMLRSLSACSRGDYVRRYLDSSSASDTGAYGRPMSGDDNASLADEMSVVDGARPSKQILPVHDTCEVDSIADDPDIDSGHFTLRGGAGRDDDSDDEGMSYPRKRNKMRDLYRYNSTATSEMVTSFDGSELGRELCLEKGLDEEMRDDVDSGTQQASRPCSVCSHSSSRFSSECATHARQASFRKPAYQQQQQIVPKPITQDPERVFKIVLAGDAAVGKSSFIMRLCKNKFVTNLNSTLGVDFQTKTLEVDGRVIALQLWDTAGQERFRSIAKSYFRRADGVLLLYDVTYERSFISVRDWLEAIEEGAQKRIPIMLVGNKSDLRQEAMAADGTKICVKMEDGQRLAKDFAGLFIETSAKDGNNVPEAVMELSRMLMTNEDLEVQTIGLKLQDVGLENARKKSPCCNL